VAAAKGAAKISIANAKCHNYTSKPLLRGRRRRWKRGGAIDRRGVGGNDNLLLLAGI